MKILLAFLKIFSSFIINYQIRIWNKKFNSILFSVNELEFLSRAFEDLFVH